jgi:hypothetical protein
VKIKLDENLPVTLAARLSALGHDTDTVIDEGLAGKADQDVWGAAQSNDRYLITQNFSSATWPAWRAATRRSRCAVTGLVTVVTVPSLSRFEGRQSGAAGRKHNRHLRREGRGMQAAASRRLLLPPRHLLGRREIGYPEDP